MKLEGSLHIQGSPEKVWSVLMDPERLAQVLPGCESLQRIDETHFAATLAVKVQFMTVRATATCELVEVEWPNRLAATMTGETTVLAGAFRNDVAMALSDIDGGTRLDYRMELTLLGRLANLGQPMVRATSRHVVQQFERNLQRLLGEASSTDD